MRPLGAAPRIAESQLNTVAWGDVRLSLRTQIALALGATLVVFASLAVPLVIVVVDRAANVTSALAAQGALKAVAADIDAACAGAPPECAPVRARAASGGEGSFTVVAQPPGAGTALRLADGRWLAVVRQRAPVTSRVLAGRNSLLAAYVGLLAALTFLMGLALLNRLLARPLDRLAQAAERIGRMDLEDPFGGRAPMLGQLGTAFERMAVSLKQERERVADQIRQLERLNRELQDARDSLVRSEKLATVGRLAAGVAHEVGNPLGAILGYLELARARAPGDAREYLDRIDNEVARIDRTVRELLDYSRPGAAAAVPVELDAAVDGAVRLATVQKRLKQVQFDVDVAPGLRVLADAHHLSQVLVNLLLNAGDAMKGEGTIRIRAERATLPAGRRATDPPPGERVCLTVSDTGPGIRQEDLPHVFDPFFTTKDPGEGTGLGLSICHRIMEAFGGEIRAANGPSGGAVFTLVFRTPEQNG